MPMETLMVFIAAYFGSRRPSRGEITAIINQQPDRYVWDDLGNVTLTEQFRYSKAEWELWRRQPWEVSPRLSIETMEAFFEFMKVLETEAAGRPMLTEVLCFRVRDNLSLAGRPLSRSDFFHLLAGGYDCYVEAGVQYAERAHRTW